MIGCLLIHIKRSAAVLRCAAPMDRDTPYIRLWLIWLAILVVGGACVVFSMGAFS